jgi:signal transduction histidine kinase
LDEEDDMPPEMKEQFLKNILQDSDRLSRLINNILDFEKLSTGREVLILKKHNIKNTIARALNSCINIASKKEIVIEMTYFHGIELYYDEDRILQVLTNFLSNAIKFCEAKKGLITIDCEVLNGYVKVYVEDNGRGIPVEDFNYIFDKFYQSKNQNTIKLQGSGLGLAICKQIIQKHNGKIWAEKDKKTGASFAFMLPFN